MDKLEITDWAGDILRIFPSPLCVEFNINNRVTVELTERDTRKLIDYLIRRLES